MRQQSHKDDEHPASHEPGDILHLFLAIISSYWRCVKHISQLKAAIYRCFSAGIAVSAAIRDAIWTRCFAQTNTLRMKKHCTKMRVLCYTEITNSAPLRPGRANRVRARAAAVLCAGARCSRRPGASDKERRPCPACQGETSALTLRDPQSLCGDSPPFRGADLIPAP